MTRTRSYSELKRLGTFEERFEYLKLDGVVGEITFGFDRWLNQRFYTSREWRDIREAVIIRDEGCDLGVSGYDITAHILIHHMNPIAASDIVHSRSWILDPEYLITTTRHTHNAIHYGDGNLLPKQVIERHPGDTKLW